MSFTRLPELDQTSQTTSIITIFLQCLIVTDHSFISTYQHFVTICLPTKLDERIVYFLYSRAFVYKYLVELYNDYLPEVNGLGIILHLLCKLCCVPFVV